MSYVFLDSQLLIWLKICLFTLGGIKIDYYYYWTNSVRRILWTTQTRLWTRLPFNTRSRNTPLTEIKLTYRNKALRNKTKQTKEILPFFTTYNPATPNLKMILMKRWDIIQEQPKLKKSHRLSPTGTEKSLVNILSDLLSLSLIILIKNLEAEDS